MTDRYQLIARKEEVRRRIERLRSRLDHEYGEEPVKRNRLVRTLEDELERLMAEEYSLRVAIDRSK